MYTVYADDILIHSPDMVAENIYLVNTTFEKEINKSGSCEFDIYKDHPYYNYLKNLKTTIVVKDNGEEVWRGRVITSERNFDNTKHIYCEGVMSFMLDSVIRPYQHTKTMAEQFAYIITQHNSQVESYKQFTIGQITVDDLYGSISWENTEYPDTMSEIDNIVGTYGGYLVTNYVNGENVISYVKDPGTVSNQTIEFGDNLLDFTETLDSSNIFTVLIPVGYDANGNKITIESVNDGKDYLESESGIALYGRVVRQYTFEDDVTSATEVKEKGITLLNNNLTSAKSISISALDLHMLDPTIDKINVYALIKVKSKPHDIDEYELCSKVFIDLDNPDSNEYTIGTVPEGIGSMVSGTSSNTVSGGSSLPNGDNVQY